MIDRRKHAAGASGLYYAVAALLGLAAHTLLASPLCHHSARVLRLWSLVSMSSLVVASIVAAAALRSLVRGRSKASLWAAGVLHPLLSAVVFAPLSVWVSGLVRGHGESCLASLLYTIYGPMMFGLTAYVSVPLGMLGVWAMRAVWQRSGDRGCAYGAAT